MRNLKTVNYDEMFTLSAPSPKWVWNAQGQLVEVPAGQPAWDHDPVTGESLGQRLEGEATNLLLNSFAPATQTVSVSDATTYTLSVYGSGSAEVTAGGSGTATDGSPLTFTTTGTSVTVTVTGTLDVFQLETGSAATSPIETNGSAVTRAADVATIENLDTAEWFGLNEGWTVILECTATHYPVDAFCFAMVLGSSNLTRAAFYFFDGKARAQFRAGPIFEVSANYQPGDKIIFGVSYDPTTGTRVVALNGTADSNILSMDFSGSEVRLGSQFSSNPEGRFLISDIIFRKRAKTAAELQGLTAP
tara:strand:- start:351 stop:1262 length:912 start_codon:yes stop_codon:yes gene_type:complete